MKLYITIDGGTTNTRITLVGDKRMIDGIKLNIGARKSIENRSELEAGIKEAIETLLKRNGICEKDIVCVLASGMITSEFGLCCLDHITAPAGIGELNATTERIQLDRITSIPFVFIRGVKVDTDSFESFDIMRGEETELMGIMNAEYGECIYVLPGSHSKIIRVDELGRITDFSTMMTGEMIGALAGQTILKDAVDLSISEVENEYLLKGYDYSLKEGINKALFKARVLKNFFECGKKEVYSFFLGVVLASEMIEITNNSAQTVVIGGKAQMRNAMAEILEKRSNKRVVRLDEDTVNMSTSLGAIRIFEYK